MDKKFSVASLFMAMMQDLVASPGIGKSIPNDPPVKTVVARPAKSNGQRGASPQKSPSRQANLYNPNVLPTVGPTSPPARSPPEPPAGLGFALNTGWHTRKERDSKNETAIFFNCVLPIPPRRGNRAVAPVG